MGNPNICWCRLCNSLCVREIDIFKENGLCKMIDEVHQILVEPTDKSTKICRNCFSEVKILDKKKKLIAETDKKMKSVPPNHTDEASTAAAAAAGDIKGMRGVDGDDSLSDVDVVDLTGPDSPIILIEDESDDENGRLSASTVQTQRKSSDTRVIPTRAPNTSFALQSFETQNNVLLYTQNETMNTEQHAEMHAESLPTENSPLLVQRDVSGARGSDVLVGVNPPLLEISHSIEIGFSANLREGCSVSATFPSRCEPNLEGNDDDNVQIGRNKSNRSNPVSARGIVKRCHCNGNQARRTDQERQFEPVNIMEKERESNETEVSFKCLPCKITFSREQAHKRHMHLTHSFGAKFKCSMPKCARSFSKQTYLERHTATTHANDGSSSRSVEVNGKMNRTKKLTKFQRNSHRVQSTNLQQADRPQCSFAECSRTFRNQSNRKRHENYVHIKRIAFKCMACAKEFFHPYSLKRHMLIHDKPTSFIRNEATSACNSG